MNLAELWAERSARERSVLAAGAAVALVLALYGLLWEPGLKASAKLGVALPRLRAQVEDMRAQQKEILQLRKTAGTTASQVADLRALLRAAVARGPLAAAAPSIEWQSNDRVVFAAAAVDFDSWLQWIAGVQRELGIRLESCTVTALGEPGRVRVEASFAGTRVQ
jgi:type II secretory pathway component PulM